MDLIRSMGLEENNIDGVFVNGKIKSFETVLCDGDRVAVLPPGIPGPYRVLLGLIKNNSNVQN